MNITNKKENSPNNAKTNNNTNNNNRRNRTNNNNNNNNNRRNSTTNNNNDNKLNINQNTAVNQNTNKNPSCSLGLYRQNCSSINSISSLNENIINVDFVQNSDNNGQNFLNNGKNNHNNCQNFHSKGQNCHTNGQNCSNNGQNFHNNGQNSHNNGQNCHNNGQNSLNRRRENKCYESRTHSSERGLCNNEVFERGRGNGRSRRNCRADRSYHRGSNERCENWDGGAQCSRRNEEEVFWSENCAVMLNYHRWLNSYPNEANETEAQPSDLKFDARRNTVTSNAGLRLIELRGHKALCLRYWSFLSPSQSRKCFILPIQYLTSALTLVAIDNVGSIVKVELR
ncbi:GATA zinc finger domain-containing protein 14-like [Diaphorina citri]|uniref:GATA zinc finger domain-containing protein 14-like n=1 Tax=Diaphorina citri TaxID=121845 RepID=A0A3Q0ILG0_DIACI|nr:GATA zinc finger domain-containing protein 14-like [Diaphorina citri]